MSQSQEVGARSSRTTLQGPCMSESRQEVVVPSDTGQPSARSSCGSAGPPGTPLWSPHAPWPAAGHTHPSAPLRPIPLDPLGPYPLTSKPAWHLPSGSCLLAGQPLAHPQGSPSVVAEQWPSGLVAGYLGCCCWWRSWPWGLGQPEALVEQWQWGQQGLGCWVGAAAGVQAEGPDLQGSGPHAGNAGSAPSRVGAQATGNNGCC